MLFANVLFADFYLHYRLFLNSMHISNSVPRVYPNPEATAKEPLTTQLGRWKLLVLGLGLQELARRRGSH